VQRGRDVIVTSSERLRVDAKPREGKCCRCWYDVQVWCCQDYDVRGEDAVPISQFR